MRTAFFHLTLDADVVVTERFAAQGSYPGLPFLPGNLFLGAAARRLYDALPVEDAFLVFHSGRVRFGAAYPVFDGEPALPVPFSWFAPKGEKPTLNGEHANVTNLLRRKDRGKGDDPKFKQLREGYFTLQGRIDKPATGYRLKTAIDRDRGGRAKDSQLFGYEHLASDSDWWFTVSADEDSVAESLFQAVTSALTGRIRIGRSRAAEYGAATVRQVAANPGAFPSATIQGMEVVLYCLSDLALCDPETGNPTVAPTGSQFGIPELTFDASRSYLRRRTYTTFNAKRSAADLERQTIERGSVLVFKAVAPLTEHQINLLRRAGEVGIGMYRQEGLGRILIEPAFLSYERLEVSAHQVTPLKRQTRSQQTSPAAADLIGWLQEKHATTGLRRQSEDIVDGWVAELLPKILAFGPDAPSKSQWSRLRNLSGPISSMDQMATELGKICAHGVSEKQWSARFQYRSRWLSFAEFLLSAPDTTGARKDCGDDLVLFRECIRILGERMAHGINQQKANGGGA